MKQEELLEFVEETYTQCLRLIEKKNSDYAENEDALKNFKLAESLGVSTQKGILIRMTDKLTRIAHLIEREAHVEDESLEDTIHDLINYTALLKASLQE